MPGIVLLFPGPVYVSGTGDNNVVSHVSAPAVSIQSPSSGPSSRSIAFAEPAQTASDSDTSTTTSGPRRRNHLESALKAAPLWFAPRPPRGRPHSAGTIGNAR